MSQSSPGTIVPGTTSGTELAALLTNAFSAIYSAHAGSSAPSYIVAGLQWLDDSDVDVWIQKVFDGAANLEIGHIDTANHIWLPPVGGGQGSISSAGNIDLWSTPESNIIVSGATGPITKMAGSGAVLGTEKTVTFTGAPTLTYHATQLILPGGRDIVVEAGDHARVMALGSGNVVFLSYNRASGLSLYETPGHRKVQRKTASYTVARIADVGSLIRYDSGSAGVLTLAPTSGESWVIGDRIDGAQIGTGQLTVAGGVGVTVSGNLKTAAQWSAFSAEYVGVDSWEVYGSMTS